jgi:hypothetical protein
MVCIRRAWLVLGGRTFPLEDVAAGYVCAQLDLGYPAVRDVTANRPDQNGIDDRTAFFGSRAISAEVRATGGTMLPDEVATYFAPLMVPSARPELHYVLDRPGTPERMTTVRAATYGWPITGAPTRTVHLGWVASDPVMRDVVDRRAIAWAAWGVGGGGRAYDLTFAREYHHESRDTIPGVIAPAGDVGVRPLIRVYGPIVDPVVTFRHPSDTEEFAWLRFVPGFELTAGEWVDIDLDAKTVTADSIVSAATLFDWQTSAWPAIPPAPPATTFTLTGQYLSTAVATQAQATWRDGWLS